MVSVLDNALCLRTLMDAVHSPDVSLLLMSGKDEAVLAKFSRSFVKAERKLQVMVRQALRDFHQLEIDSARSATEYLRGVMLRRYKLSINLRLTSKKGGEFPLYQTSTDDTEKILKCKDRYQAYVRWVHAREFWNWKDPNDVRDYASNKEVLRDWLKAHPDHKWSGC